MQITRDDLHLLAAWTAVMAIALGLSIYLYDREKVNDAEIEARTHLELVMELRTFVARMGGVYVAEGMIAPNPYLHMPKSAVRTTDGDRLSLVNPAYMTRLLLDEFNRRSERKAISKITSLRLVNPGNAPDEWEQRGLHAFERGERERFELTTLNGAPYLRIMRPLIAGQECLSCHAEYHVGDIRGGISVSVPLKQYFDARATVRIRFALIDASVWLVGCIGIIGFSRKRSAQELRLTESERKFRAIFDRAHDGILVVDAETYRFYMVNDQMCAMLGYAPDEVTAFSVANIHPVEELPRAAEKFHDIMTGKTTIVEDIPVLRRDGSIFHASISASPLELNGRIYAIGIFHDITERQMAERLRAESLEQKETLLREIHHRVKNNLQIISSILYFQAKKVTDVSGVAALREGQDRLRSMILVHEMLYRSGDLAHVDFAEYLRSLTAHLRQSHAEHGDRVSLRVKLALEHIKLPIESALPCGMILNELLTNAFKYAFPPERAGEITVVVSKDADRLVIIVSDNGIGLRPGTDADNPKTFGMQLVRNLSAQLNGSVQYATDDGTTVTVTIPLSNTRSAHGEIEDIHRRG